MSRHQKLSQVLCSVMLVTTLGVSLNAVYSSGAIAHSDTVQVAETSNAQQFIAPLFENLGTHTVPISTQNPLVQRYFDQGIMLTYGFNHAEALRSFQYAAELDPSCAMCYWGMAYVLGPNINAAMDAGAVPTAWEAIQNAVALSDSASDREKAYINALATRYSPDPEGDRVALNLAYANAMRQVAQAYPDDLDAATLFAESLMDTMPWDYWDESGNPKPEGAEIISTLEVVLAQNPDHPGALHLYIHAVEAERPDLAADAADRLRALDIQTGHLIHMPAHIYLRVGRYQDAIIANAEAAAADREYAQAQQPEGIYRIGYMPHNEHFRWYAAMLAGDKETALDAAEQTAALVEQSLIREPGFGTLQHYSTIPLYTWVKFELWDEILAAPAPDADLVYPTGVWHFARGMTLTAQGKLDEAAQELDSLQAIAHSPDLEGVTIWEINTTSHLLSIATEVLAGELAAKQGDFEGAIAHLQAGVALEDQLTYEEPSSWYAPVRQNLGNVLLQAGRYAEAESVYRDDLAIYPNNHWSLYGLSQSLNAQGKTEESEAIQQSLADR